MRWKNFWAWWSEWFGEPKPLDVIFAVLGAAHAEIDVLPKLDPMSIEEHSLFAQTKVKVAKKKIATLSTGKEKSDAITILDEILSDLETIRNQKSNKKFVERKAKDVHLKIQTVLDLLQ